MGRDLGKPGLHLVRVEQDHRAGRAAKLNRIQEDELIEPPRG